MTSVTAFRQLIEGFRKAILILRFNCFVELADRNLHHFFNQLWNRKLGIFVRRMVHGDVIEALVQLIQFIARQRPIRVLPGEPEFHMPHLLECHDLPKAWGIGRFRLPTAREQVQRQKDHQGRFFQVCPLSSGFGSPHYAPHLY